jgi:hypothetical protein
MRLRLLGIFVLLGTFVGCGGSPTSAPPNPPSKEIPISPKAGQKSGNLKVVEDKL